MKLGNLDKVLTAGDGKEFSDGSTMRKILGMAAGVLLDGPQDGSEKYKAGMILVKIQKAQKSVELSAEDVTLLKARVGKIFPPLVVVRVEDALEQRKPAEARIAQEIDQDEEPAKA